uniref:Uncharacterized protein n=1 Tax=Rhizophora mucronata TaxID=61149 RepID=A0A2P2QW63_RHIMU
MKHKLVYALWQVENFSSMNKLSLNKKHKNI